MGTKYSKLVFVSPTFEKSKPPPLACSPIVNVPNDRNFKYSRLREYLLLPELIDEDLAIRGSGHGK
jgi:hypothetical protein